LEREIERKNIAAPDEACFERFGNIAEQLLVAGEGGRIITTYEVVLQAKLEKEDLKNSTVVL
jgi:hypothetical protein